MCNLFFRLCLKSWSIICSHSSKVFYSVKSCISFSFPRDKCEYRTVFSIVVVIIRAFVSPAMLRVQVQRSWEEAGATEVLCSAGKSIPGQRARLVSFCPESIERHRLKSGHKLLKWKALIDFLAFSTGSEKNKFQLVCVVFFKALMFY